jgi:hypothetical protein
VAVDGALEWSVWDLLCCVRLFHFDCVRVSGRIGCDAGMCAEGGVMCPLCLKINEHLYCALSRYQGRRVERRAG